MPLSKEQARDRYNEACSLIDGGESVLKACKQAGLGIGSYYYYRNAEAKKPIRRTRPTHQIVPVIPTDDSDEIGSDEGKFSITFTGSPRQIGELFRSLGA